MLTLDADQITRILDAIGSRGCASRDFRFAVHEAHHALTCGLRKPWTSDNIHAAVLRAARKSLLLTRDEALVRFELQARAVEWIACERAGIEYDLDYWAHIMWMETYKNMNILLPINGEIAEGIKTFKALGRTERAADAVLSLQPRARKRTRKAA